MIKRFGIVTIWILMASIFLSSCSFSLGKKNMFGSLFISDKETANTRMDKILEAIKNKDEDELKSMFSKQAIEKSEDIDNKIRELLDFFQGDLVSYNSWAGPVTEETVDYGDKQKKLSSTYEVITTKQKYRIAIEDITIDTVNKDNVGIWSFYIIKFEDDNNPEYAYYGDGKETPGINFNMTYPLLPSIN